MSISTNKSDILKTKGKLKIMRDNMVYHNLKYTITTGNTNSVQNLLRYIIFITFHIFSLPSS